MVCQVMFASPAVEAVLDDVEDAADEVDDEVDDEDAAGPPQAARATTALVASSAAGAVQLLIRRLLGMLSVTSRSVSRCCPGVGSAAALSVGSVGFLLRLTVRADLCERSHPWKDCDRSQFDRQGRCRHDLTLVICGRPGTATRR